MILYSNKKLILHACAISNLFLSKTPKYFLSNRPNLQNKIESASQAIIKNKGLNSFLNKIYLTTTLAFSGSLLTCYLAAMNYLPFVNYYAAIGITICSLVGVIYIKPTLNKQYFDGKIIYSTKNSIQRIALYYLGTFGVGFSLSPLIPILSSQLILPSIAIAIGILCGISIITYMKPKNNLLKYKNIVNKSLYAVIGIQFIQMTGIMSGQNSFLEFILSKDKFAGVTVFSLIASYDINVAINQYQQGKPDDLKSSLDLFLNIWNIFINTIRILMPF